MAFWADALRGTLVIIIIMIVAGAIAYVGDRVGHQIGRKRLTLFGIRPRYTSTIVAVGTGMLIALIVTSIAILFSQQVKTALFRMNQISAEITTLQTQQKALESKVNGGQLVQPVNGLMFPLFGYVPRGAPVEERLARVNAFYSDAVRFINANYPGLGLKQYKIPADIQKTLTDTYGQPAVTEESQSADLLMLIVADQNLYRGDDVHFELDLIPDVRAIPKGTQLGAFQIPAGAAASLPSSLPLAIGQLRQQVASVAQNEAHLPPALANTVQIAGYYPSQDQMESMLRTGKGNYVLSAFASMDVYPHFGGVPIVVTLTQAK